MGKFSFEEVNELYVDVLREIGNIGSGNATCLLYTSPSPRDRG